MYSVGTPTEYDIAHSHIRAEGAHRVSNKSVIVLEICWKSVQTLISLPVRGYRLHPNRDEFGCETLDESIRVLPFVTCETSQSGLSFVRLRSSQLVTSFVRLHSSTTFVCETLQFDHFVCETSQKSITSVLHRSERSIAAIHFIAARN